MNPVVQKVTTPVGDPAWLVQDYDMVRALLKDPRLWRSHADPDNAPRLSSTSIFGGALPTTPTERADHTRMRHALAPLFAGRRMAEMRVRVREQVRSLLDRLEDEGSPGDLHGSLSAPLHVLASCALLGVPDSDHAAVSGWSDDVASLDDPERSMTGWTGLWEYMLALAEDKRRAPTQDALSDLMATYAGEPDAALQVAELGAQMFAGHSTVVAAIDEGTLMLLVDRERWDVVRDQPEQLTGAVEEILRLCLPTPDPDATTGSGLPRWATEDFEVAGTAIGKGELVLLDLQAANQDDTRFPEPATFDPRRVDNPHVTFGHGTTLCIGRPLARIELQEVFSGLPQRFPDLRLAGDAAKLTHRDDSVVGGLTELPVRWG